MSTGYREILIEGLDARIEALQKTEYNKRDSLRNLKDLIEDFLQENTRLIDLGIYGELQQEVIAAGVVSGFCNGEIVFTWGWRNREMQYLIRKEEKVIHAYLDINKINPKCVEDIYINWRNLDNE